MFIYPYKFGVKSKQKEQTYISHLQQQSSFPTGLNDAKFPLSHWFKRRHVTAQYVTISYTKRFSAFPLV